MDNGFKFAEKNAICTESSSPYKARGGTCEAASCTVGIPKGDVKGYKDVTSDNEQALMSAVQQQPVSIAIEADKMAFQSYKSGILSSTCGSNLCLSLSKQTRWPSSHTRAAFCPALAAATWITECFLSGMVRMAARITGK